jgi:hypothetical protein
MNECIILISSSNDSVHHFLLGIVGATGATRGVLGSTYALSLKPVMSGAANTWAATVGVSVCVCLRVSGCVLHRLQAKSLRIVSRRSRVRMDVKAVVCGCVSASVVSVRECV